MIGVWRWDGSLVDWTLDLWDPVLPPGRQPQTELSSGTSSWCQALPVGMGTPFPTHIENWWSAPMREKTHFLPSFVYWLQVKAATSVAIVGHHSFKEAQGVGSHIKLCFPDFLQGNSSSRSYSYDLHNAMIYSIKINKTHDMQWYIIYQNKWKKKSQRWHTMLTS